MAPSSSAAGSRPKPKPTVLAFHGSGSNATIHSVQLARLKRVIKAHFDVESLEAPFPSPPGPGILPFFTDCGPYKRWLPPTEPSTQQSMHKSQPPPDAPPLLPPEVEARIAATVHRLHASGATVIGLLGFSQGTRIVAGLLRGVQMRRALGAQAGDAGGWLDGVEFGVSVCGSHPPPVVPGSVVGAVEGSGLAEGERRELLGGRIRVPTFHVQGARDEWNWAGRGMIEAHFELGEGMSEVVEWDIGHHYPVAPEESERIGEWMVEVLGKAKVEAR